MTISEMIATSSYKDTVKKMISKYTLELEIASAKGPIILRKNSHNLPKILLPSLKKKKKVEQTSKLIKAPNSTIQRLGNAIVGAMKINSQEIAHSIVVPRSIYTNQRQRA
jgi:hypothetical protein